MFFFIVWSYKAISPELWTAVLLKNEDSMKKSIGER